MAIFKGNQIMGLLVAGVGLCLIGGNVVANGLSSIPLLAIAMMLDKPITLLHAVSNLSVLSVFSVIYLSFSATLFGYGIWSILLAKYPTGKVAPLSLLVPITGLITAQIILAEKLSVIQWLGGILIIFGLLVSNFSFSTIQCMFRTKDL